MTDDLNYLDPKSPLQRIAEKLDGETTTQVDPDSLMQRIATSVENGAGGGGGGYSKKPGETVIFEGNAVFVHVVENANDYYILKESAESEIPVVILDKFYGETTLPSELTLTGLPEVLFGATTRVFHFRSQNTESGIITATYSYDDGDDNQLLEIMSNLEHGQSALHIQKDALGSSLEDVYNVNLKLYGTTEVLEVTKDFTDAVGVVTGYKIDTIEKALLDTYHVEEVPNNSSQSA